MADITYPARGIAPAGNRISVGGVIAGTFATLARGFVIFYAASLLLVLLGLPTALNALAGKGGSVGLHGLAALFAVVKPIASLFIQVPLILVAMRVVADEPPRLGDAIGAGARRVLAYVGATIVVLLGILLGTVLLIVPGIILACMYGLSPVVCVVEREGPIASQSRSRELTRGNRWRVLGASLLFFGPPFLFFAGVGVYAGAMHTAAALPRSFAFQVAALAFSFVYNPVYVVFPVVLYDRLRRATGAAGVRGIAGVFD